jgi:hypothetical protein
VGERRGGASLARGCSKQGLHLEPSEDGLHPPSLQSNSKNKPLAGKCCLALPILAAELCPGEKRHGRSASPLHSRSKRAKLAFQATGHTAPFAGTLEHEAHAAAIRESEAAESLQEKRWSVPAPSQKISPTLVPQALTATILLLLPLSFFQRPPPYFQRPPLFFTATLPGTLCAKSRASKAVVTPAAALCHQ